MLLLCWNDQKQDNIPRRTVPQSVWSVILLWVFDVIFFVSSVPAQSTAHLIELFEVSSDENSIQYI